MDSGSCKSNSGFSETVYIFMTSFKVWLLVYGVLLVSFDTLMFSYIPLLVLGTLIVFGIVQKFKVATPKQEYVEGFFGKQFRPAGETLNGPQSPGLTVKSRLNLMNSSGKDDMAGDGPLTIFGHRGAGLDAPENSISAIRLCAQRGCRAVEFDVSLTKDQVPVLFHDDNLVRIAGIDREISDMTWDELKTIDISVLHPLGERFRGERIPTFDEAVNTCLSLGIKFVIDLKDENEKVIDAVLAAFQRNKEMYSMGMVSSFYFRVIYEIRRRDPNIIGGMAWRPGYFRYVTWNASWENCEPRHKSIWRDCLAIVTDVLNDFAVRNIFWWFLGLSAFYFNKDAFSKEETFRWMKKGIRFYVWTVNSPLEKLQLIQNVQIGYMTDTLDGCDQTTAGTVTAQPQQQPQVIAQKPTDLLTTDHF